MGAWNETIEGNDTFADLYDEFMRLVEEGMEPSKVGAELRQNMAEYFEDYDDGQDSLFALGKAQWEHDVLEPEVYNAIKEIVESGSNLENWRERGASDESLEIRQVVLQEFLELLGTKREG